MPEESTYLLDPEQQITDLIAERDDLLLKVDELSQKLESERKLSQARLDRLHAAEAKVRELTRQPDVGDLATSLARSEAAMQEAFLKHALQGRSPDAYTLVQQMDRTSCEHRTWLEPRK